MKIESLLKQQEEIIDSFILTCKAKPSSKNVTNYDWKVKDILAHVTSWHVYYAHIVRSLARGETPELKKLPLRDVNAEGVAELSKFNKKQLIKRLKSAQRDISRYFPKLTVKEVPYHSKKSYPKTKYLTVINNHIKKHTEDIAKTK